MVSDDPASTEATLPAKLSGPQSSYKAVNKAVEPLPDTGLKRTIGTISFGKPKKSAAGEMKLHITSIAPLERSKSTANTNPIMVGAIVYRTFTPSRTPLINKSKTGTRFISPYNTTTVANRGIIIAIISPRFFQI